MVTSGSEIMEEILRSVLHVLFLVEILLVSTGGKEELTPREFLEVCKNQLNPLETIIKISNSHSSYSRFTTQVSIQSLPLINLPSFS